MKVTDLNPGERAHELASIVALTRSELVPAAKLGSLVDEVGSAVRLVQLSESDRLFAQPDASHALVGAVTDQDVARALRDVSQWLERVDFEIRSVLDRHYPAELHEIFNRPALLFVRGDWPAMSVRPAIAVVGARAASPEGQSRARRLASELVESGFAVLSGLAVGVDTAAHTGALDAGGSTSAVIGTGLDRMFPAENAPLAERILTSGGAIVSQFFPAQPPTRWTFPMRNVVMSGLAMATVVVEASETSGARMQARVALQHGRTVFLLRSLVERHEWARRYVAEGAYGTQAIEINSTQEIVSRLEGREADVQLRFA